MRGRLEKLLTLANWLFVSMAIIGTFCVSALKAPYVGHWLWLFSNTGLVVLAIRSKAWPYAAMFSIYFVLSLWGLWTWGPA